MAAAGISTVALGAALRSAGTGDRQAFRRVYDRTSAKLYGICLRITGDPAAAEDVLHEVYLVVWRKAATFDAERASPITWLAMIARNRAIDWKRAQDRQIDRFGMMLPPYVPEESERADEALDIAEREQAAMRCLEQLHEEQRIPIRQAFLDGVTYAKLAERMREPLGTIKSRIRRGLLELRKCMGHA